jgi:hypothetical protein
VNPFAVQVQSAAPELPPCPTSLFVLTRLTEAGGTGYTSGVTRCWAASLELP